MDVKSLSNTELKEQLLKRGVKPGPILPSTRSVYERKLQQLMEALVKQNGPGNEDRYSDSEDEESPPMKNEVESREKIDMRTRNEMYNKAKIPASLAAEYNQNLANLGDDFSVTRILKQMERRSSLGHVPMHKREQDSKSLPSQPDADSPDLPDPMSQSLLGMSATRRKPIKGAAGRPIQFRYDDLATKARMQEHTKSTTVETGKKRLVSVPLQIALFLLIAFIAVVLLTMEGSPENPFVSLSEKTAESEP
ncbi:LEM domain-containing protein 1 isoform X2 [Spea bombifrons]|nr:LEM domain-containing protein 1 isoform X2 [Spea bombifrons]